jgi:hypothetical protein
MATKDPFQPKNLTPSASSRPPKQRTFARVPTGSRLFNRKAIKIGGPGIPPPGFVGAKTSASEWMIYWALAKVYNSPRDPRVGPYFGAEDGSWVYQSYQRAPTLSGRQNIDFTAQFRGELVAIRIETERYHIFVDPIQAAFDREAIWIAEKWNRVQNIYEQDFIGDPSGQAAIILVKEVLRNEQRPDPRTAGIARRVRAA